jgi:hypothetical protein
VDRLYPAAPMAGGWQQAAAAAGPGRRAGRAPELPEERELGECTFRPAINRKPPPQPKVCVCVGGGAGGRAGGVAVREQLGLAGWLYSVVMGLHPAAAVASWRAEGKGRGVSAGQSVGRQPQHSVLWLCTCYYACSLSCWLLHPLPPAAITFYTC